MKRIAGIVGFILFTTVLPVAAQDWGPCASLSDNLVAGLNCDFTDGVNHWTFDSAMGIWTTNDTTGYPVAPSASAEASDPGSYSFTITSECLTVSGATTYALGLYSQTPSSPTVSCVGRIVEFSTADCSGASSTSPDGPFVPGLNVWSSWTVVWATAAATQSALGVVECSDEASFTVLFDNIAVVEGTVVPVELIDFTVD